MSRLLLAVGLLVGCEDSPPPPAVVEAPVEATPHTPPAAITPTLPPEPEPVADATALTLGTDGNRMVFDKTTLTAPAGTLRLTFTNGATVPAMQHNVLIVTAGSEDEVGVAGIAAGPDKNYVPELEAVLAASPLLSPGESAELLVTLQPGEYAFICTFPGHYLTMKGTLIITEPVP